MTGTVDVQELKRLAEAATAGNLDTVPNPPNEYGGKDEEGCVVCPQCDGEGAVDAVTYTNFDGVAMGVQFFGIGNAFQRYEAYFRAASPDAILALIEVAEAAEKAHEARKTQSFTDLLLAMERIRTALEGVKK